MDRLTCKRCNGIKDGYWSPAKKEELVQRLAEYENLGDLRELEYLKQKSIPRQLTKYKSCPKCGRYMGMDIESYCQSCGQKIKIL